MVCYMKRVFLICAMIGVALSVSYLAKVNEEWQWRYSYLEDLRTTSGNSSPILSER